MVHLVTSATEFRDILAKHPLVICDFTASWCGPCKMIAPVFESLAEKHKDIYSIKLDVDQVQQIAAEEGITAMPTFKVYLQGRVIRECQGADRNLLAAMIPDAISFYQSKLKERDEKRNQPVTETEEELMSKSVKDLKQMLLERGLSLTGLAEKGDLVKRLKGQ